MQSSSHPLMRVLFSAFHNGKQCSGWLLTVFDELIISSLLLLKSNQALSSMSDVWLVAVVPGSSIYLSIAYSFLKASMSPLYSVFPCATIPDMATPVLSSLLPFTASSWCLINL